MILTHKSGWCARHLVLHFNHKLSRAHGSSWKFNEGLCFLGDEKFMAWNDLYSFRMTAINTCGYKGNLCRLSVMKEFPVQVNSIVNVYNYNTFKWFNGYKTNL